jgi:hypothetical protein
MVYKDIGEEMLQHAFEGRNSVYKLNTFFGICEVASYWNFLDAAVGHDSYFLSCRL